MTNRSLSDIRVSQGWGVILWGLGGSLVGLVPAALPRFEMPWSLIIPILWACLIGLPVTYFWSKTLHSRVNMLRGKLDSIGALSDDEKSRYPGRLDWMPAWLGLFERAFYCVLIGLDITGGAAFIGVWVAMKSAGGWQVWSKGTIYGHALFFAGLLGNAMSILFGVVAGLVIRSSIKP